MASKYPYVCVNHSTPFEACVGSLSVDWTIRRLHLVFQDGVGLLQCIGERIAPQRTTSSATDEVWRASRRGLRAISTTIARFTRRNAVPPATYFSPTVARWTSVVTSRRSSAVTSRRRRRAATVCACPSPAPVARSAFRTRRYWRMTLASRAATCWRASALTSRRRRSVGVVSSLSVSPPAPPTLSYRSWRGSPSSRTSFPVWRTACAVRSAAAGGTWSTWRAARSTGCEGGARAAPTAARRCAPSGEQCASYGDGRGARSGCGGSPWRRSPASTRPSRGRRRAPAGTPLLLRTRPATRVTQRLTVAITQYDDIRYWQAYILFLDFLTLSLRSCLPVF